MNNLSNTYIIPEHDFQDNHSRNTIYLKDNAENIFLCQKKMSESSDSKSNIQTLLNTSNSLAKEADAFADETLEDPSEDNEGYTEADKETHAKYNDVIKKQSSLIEEGHKILSDNDRGVMNNPQVKSLYLDEYNKYRKAREVLLSDREKLEQDLPGYVLENKSEGSVDNIESESKESSKDKGKRKMVDDLDESANKRSKKDEADKGENTTDPAAKPSIIDDFADTSLEMPEHTAGDD
jgi:hypothetical protein